MLGVIENKFLVYCSSNVLFNLGSLGHFMSRLLKWYLRPCAPKSFSDVLQKAGSSHDVFLFSVPHHAHPPRHQTAGLCPTSCAQGEAAVKAQLPSEQAVPSSTAGGQLHCSARLCQRGQNQGEMKSEWKITCSVEGRGSTEL